MSMEIFPDETKLQRRFRSVNWVRLGVVLNNVSLAVGLGLFLYYGLQWLELDFVPEVEPEAERRYGLILFSTALALNLVSYLPMAYGKRLSKRMPSYVTGEGAFDYERFQREKAQREAARRAGAEERTRAMMASAPSFHEAKEDGPVEAEQEKVAVVAGEDEPDGGQATVVYDLSEGQANGSDDEVLDTEHSDVLDEEGQAEAEPGGAESGDASTSVVEEEDEAEHEDEAEAVDASHEVSEVVKPEPHRAYAVQSYPSFNEEEKIEVEGESEVVEEPAQELTPPVAEEAPEAVPVNEVAPRPKSDLAAAQARVAELRERLAALEARRNA